MPLSTLLLYAYTPKSHIEDGPLGVSVNRSDFNPERESVLYFACDATPRFHETCMCHYLECSQTPKCCDGLVYYYRAPESETDQPKRVLCFVELKGRNTERAALQIKAVYDCVITNGLKKMNWVHPTDDFALKAVIVSSSAILNQGLKDCLSVLSGSHPKIQVYQRSVKSMKKVTYLDLEEYLRGTPASHDSMNNG